MLYIKKKKNTGTGTQGNETLLGEFWTWWNPAWETIKASKWSPLFTLLVQDYVPCVNRTWPGNCLWLPPSPTGVVPYHLGLWLAWWFARLWSPRWALPRHTPAPYLDVKYRWSWPMPLPQLTHQGGKFFHKAGFFFLNLESPGEFYSNSGLVALEVKHTFPRGTETCPKRLSHATSWEPPGLLTAGNQGGGREPMSLWESMHVPHTGTLRPPVTACSLSWRRAAPHWVTAVSTMRHGFCFSCLMPPWGGVLIPILWMRNGGRPRRIMWPVQEACSQVHCLGWRLRGRWVCWGRSGVVLSEGRDWGLTQATPGDFPQAVRLKWGLHQGTGEKMDRWALGVKVRNFRMRWSRTICVGSGLVLPMGAPARPELMLPGGAQHHAVGTGTEGTWPPDPELARVSARGGYPEALWPRVWGRAFYSHFISGETEALRE